LPWPTRALYAVCQKERAILLSKNAPIWPARSIIRFPPQRALGGPMDLTRFAEICEKAVRRAGRVLLDKLGRVSVREKGQADLVTDADFASQEAVREVVFSALPGHVVIGEEDSWVSGASGLDSEYCWVVDPLDGTTNYVHQVPHFCVSLALLHAGKPVVGAVFHPTADECFTAVRGQGAYLNRKPAHCSVVGRLSEALAAIGFPAVVRPDSPDLKVFIEAVQACQSIRRTGSAALNLAYVAAGRFDACWSFSTKAWDAAAGVLLVEEAGGVVTSPDGGPFVPEQGYFLAAANLQLHRALREVIERAGR